MKTKKYYYIGIIQNNARFKIVNRLDNTNKMAYWEDGEKGLNFGTLKRVEEYTKALNFCFIPAFVIVSYVEMRNEVEHNESN